jgi:actin-related protein 5
LLTPSEFLRQLRRRTFADEADFAMHYDKMRKSVEARLRGEGAEEAAANEAAALAAANAKKTDAELYPLLFRLDAELTPDELKEKQRQKRLKGAAEQQAQRRREKEARLQAEKQRAEMEAAEFAADPAAFIASLHRARESVLTAREERIKAESEGGQGRRSAAAKKRASLLASMGGSGGSIEVIEKNARKDRAAFQKEASFGMRDDDWAVYEDVRLPGDAGGGGGGARNDSDDERDALGKIEAKLEHFDPAGLSALRSSEAGTPAVQTPADFQVSLWVDRVRLPEMLFEPHALLGIDEAGLGEMLARTLARLDPALAQRAVRNVLLCGGSALLPNFRARIEFELRQLRPVGAPIGVRMARDAQWDAWRGAARLCSSTPFEQIFMTRAEWEEQGPDYLKEHSHSNRWAQVQPQSEDAAPDSTKRKKRI